MITAATLLLCQEKNADLHRAGHFGIGLPMTITIYFMPADINPKKKLSNFFCSDFLLTYPGKI